MSIPSPVILCGKSPQIAQGVKATLLPEYEVVRLILTPEQGVKEIPAILSGAKTFEHKDEVGTGNLDSPPVAIILGAGYEESDIEQMRSACVGKSNIPWLRPDTSKPAPPLGPEYGKALVARIKELMVELRKDGKAEQDGVQWY